MVGHYDSGTNSGTKWVVSTLREQIGMGEYFLVVDDRAFGPFTFDQGAELLVLARRVDRLACLAPAYPMEDAAAYIARLHEVQQSLSPGPQDRTEPAP